LYFSPVLFKKPSAVSSPIPVKEFEVVLFAFLYDALKINGMPNLLQIVETLEATVSSSSSLSTTQGPAIKKKD
jgi:hypothetical protein